MRAGFHEGFSFLLSRPLANPGSGIGLTILGDTLLLASIYGEQELDQRVLQLVEQDLRCAQVGLRLEGADLDVLHRAVGINTGLFVVCGLLDGRRSVDPLLAAILLSRTRLAEIFRVATPAPVTKPLAWENASIVVCLAMLLIAQQWGASVDGSVLSLMKGLPVAKQWQPLRDRMAEAVGGGPNELDVAALDAEFDRHLGPWSMKRPSAERKLLHLDAAVLSVARWGGDIRQGVVNMLRSPLEEVDEDATLPPSDR